MNAETRLAVVLFGSFVLWIPALNSVLRGELDVGAAGIRWSIGAAMVWAMLAAMNQLISGYAVATPEDGRGTSGERPSRRSSDPSDIAPAAADAATDDDPAAQPDEGVAGSETAVLPDDSMAESA